VHEDKTEKWLQVSRDRAPLFWDLFNYEFLFSIVVCEPLVRWICLQMVCLHNIGDICPKNNFTRSHDSTLVQATYACNLWQSRLVGTLTEIYSVKFYVLSVTFAEPSRK